MARIGVRSGAVDVGTRFGGRLRQAHPMTARRKAALFDMDRTLVRVDTASLYTRYQLDRGEVNWVQLVRVGFWLLRYRFGIIDAPRVAKEALRAYRGKAETALVAACEEWFPKYVMPHVCQSGREAVLRHRDAGDFLAIVTGATPYAARPLARELGIDHVIATELEVDESGCLTGEYHEPMCYGRGKIERVARLAEREGFRLEEAAFYSDSITDLPLLEQVARPIVVNPDARLRRVAKRRGWPIQNW
jgi:HAD superfamily hydrolase (TIGR01490 family)